MLQELQIPLVNTSTAVLVVDGDEESRRLLISVLEEMDVDVIESSSGLDAMRLMRILGPGFFKWAFVDLNVGDMAGDDLMQVLKMGDPEMRGILCTDDLFHSVARYNHEVYGFSEVLKKPFNLRHLRQFLPHLMGKDGQA